ncbi:MAG: hypothetical protein J7L62_03265 [Candidatus Aminicenantes bacterium]|nr:hypothetical protein [Candidatus Aminicenantes bacterium]
MEVVSLKLLDSGRIKRAKSNNIKCKPGDFCIIESPFGEEIGEVIRENSEVKKFWSKFPLEKVLRKASEKDIEFFRGRIEREKEAFKFCRERIEERGMPMKLISVKFFTNERKVMFFFSAEGRIDFRDLVKDLAKKYRMRIEMRQIGIRDEAKMLGGIGVCGRFLCCMNVLKEFKPISSNLIKNLDIKINPNKISGLCGRLMCCLSYEVGVTINLSDIGEEEE